MHITEGEAPNDAPDPGHGSETPNDAPDPGHGSEEFEPDERQEPPPGVADDFPQEPLPVPAIADSAANGHHVAAEFAAFYEHFGATICGSPVTDLILEDGVPTQYFRHIALETAADGRVRLKPLGEEAVAALAAATEVEGDEMADGSEPAIADLVEALPRHPTRRYSVRPLGQIRYVTIHHTGAATTVGPRDIADEHVEVNGWPGIAYHYVVDDRGHVSRTQDLATETFHVRQFNPVAVGVALMGDYTSDVPPPAQMDAAAWVIADLLFDLGLPIDAIRGHSEMVPSGCPGETFLTLWKPRLVRLAEVRMRSRLETGRELLPHPA